MKSGEAFAQNPVMNSPFNLTRRRFLAGAAVAVAGAAFGAFDARRVLAANPSAPAPRCAPGPISPNITL